MDEYTEKWAEDRRKIYDESKEKPKKKKRWTKAQYFRDGGK